MLISIANQKKQYKKREFREMHGFRFNISVPTISFLNSIHISQTDVFKIQFLFNRSLLNVVVVIAADI